MPKYRQIKRIIAQMIREGTLPPGSQIASISEIMEQYGVSKVTAVRALMELENEGLVTREHGRGTFVTPQDADGSYPRIKKAVCAIIPDMTNPFYIEVIASMERKLRDHGIPVELSCTEYDVEIERRLFRKAQRDRQISAIMLIATSIPHTLADVSEIRTPIVTVDSCPNDLTDKSTFISCDHFRGGYEAAEHLASLGHRAIGYVRWVYGSQARFEGFRSGLTAHGISLPESRIMTLASSEHIGEEVVDFVQRERLTALFTINDMLAIQTMKILRGHGLRIPEDVSLVGYDDVLAARYLDVPLTTVEQHEEEIGRRTAEALLALMDSKNVRKKPREIVIVPHLVIRASTAPPRSTGK